MTIKITVHCDDFDCDKFCEIYGTYDSDVEAEGFIVDPDCAPEHYCQSCWQKIKKERDEDD